MLPDMYAKIIPLVKLPRNMGEFDYEVGEKLKEKIKIGQLAEIPWRLGEKEGVVTALSEEKPLVKTKEILRILDREPFFYKAQVDLIKWASFYYCSSPATFFKKIMPEIPKSRQEKSAGMIRSGGRFVSAEKLKILKSDLPYIQYILTKFSEQNKILFHWQNQKNKNAAYIKFLEKLSKSKQIILIFPQINDIENFLKFFPSNFKTNISVMHSEMARTVYWKEWDKIRKNKTGIIIGTRQAVFAPVSNLGAVLIDNEHNASHKQWDQNPRYHSRECAEKLCELTGAKLILASHTPSIETYYKAREGGYAIVAEGDEAMIRFCNVPQNLEIIQMQNERKEENNSIFSKKASDLLKENLIAKNLSLIYLNRRGTNKFIICNDCGYIPQCPNCNLPLALHAIPTISKSKRGWTAPILANEGARAALKCHHCGYEQAVAVPCPKCFGANIRYVGTGTQKVENLIKKNFPEAKTAKLDIDAKKGGIKNILKNIGDADILIGTSSLLSYNFKKNINLIIFANIDTDLSYPSYKSMETAIQTIKSFLLLLNRQGKMLIQTYGNSSFKADSLRSSTLEPSNYEETLILREKLGYPPFSQLIKLTYKNKDSKLVKLETEKLLDFLNKRFHSDQNIHILGPVSLPVRFKKYAEEIILKINGGSGLQGWLLKNMPPDWIIDVDPVEI